jgi:hypothetical protein
MMAHRGTSIEKVTRRSILALGAQICPEAEAASTPMSASLHVSGLEREPKCFNGPETALPRCHVEP